MFEIYIVFAVNDVSPLKNNNYITSYDMITHISIF